MKRKLTKFFIAIVLASLLVFCFQSTALAIDVDTFGQEVFNALGWAVNGIVGILLWVFSILIMVPASAVLVLISGACIGNGAGIVTAEDILFSGSTAAGQVKMLDVNIFKTSAGASAVTDALRQNVSIWYYNLRTVAIVISLIVLLYIGIRMAMSSVASDKAEYKKMLKDWFASFAILFVLHYFMIIVLSVNNELVSLIYNMKDNIAVNSDFGSGDYMAELFKNVFSLGGLAQIEGATSAITYIALVGTTIAFFVLYVKRLLTVAFLIIIAPLITITYAIDKMGDGKSQALDTWLKEFVFNVLIQPFHCIIYIVFVNAAFAGASADSLSGAIFAILSMLFIFKAEDIVKKIFGFGQASTLGTMAAAGGLAVAALQSTMKVGKSAKAAGSVAGKSGSTSKSSGSSKNVNRKNNITTNPNVGGVNNPSGGVNGSGGSGAGSDPGLIAGSASTENTDSNTGANGGTVSSNGEFDNIDPSEYKRDSKTKQIANKALSTGLKGVSKAMKLSVGLSAGIMTAGATGSAATGLSVGTLANTLTGQHKFTKKVLDDKIDKLDLNRQRQKTMDAVDKYKNNNQDLSEDDLNYNLSNFMSTDPASIKDENERNLATQLQKYGGMYKSMGHKNGNDIALDDIIDFNKVNSEGLNINQKPLINALNNVKRNNQEYSNQEMENLSKNIIDDINNLGGNYRSSQNYKNLDKMEKKLASEIYKAKQVSSAIGGNVNTNKIDTKIMDIINKNNN